MFADAAECVANRLHVSCEFATLSLCSIHLFRFLFGRNIHVCGVWTLDWLPTSYPIHMQWALIGHGTLVGLCGERKHCAHTAHQTGQAKFVAVRIAAAANTTKRSMHFKRHINRSLHCHWCVMGSWDHSKITLHAACITSYPSFDSCIFHSFSVLYLSPSLPLSRLRVLFIRLRGDFMTLRWICRASSSSLRFSSCVWWA